MNKKKIKSLIIGLIEYAISALAIFFVVKLIIEQWYKIQDNFFSLNYYAILASLILGIFSLFVQGLAWYYLHKTIGKKVRLIEILNAYFTSNLIRYIPGNIWSYLARIRLHGKLGVSASETLYLSLIEIVFWIISGWAIFLFSLFFWTKPLVISNKYTIFIIISILFVVFAVFAPVVIKWYIRKHTKHKINFSFMRLPMPKLIKIFFLYVLFWIFYGLSFYFSIIAFTQISPLIIIPAIGINALAWLIGFISFITPSGIGAREPAMIFFLASYLSTALSGAISILARIVTIIGDIAVVVIAKITKYYVINYSQRKAK